MARPGPGVGARFQPGVFQHPGGMGVGTHTPSEGGLEGGWKVGWKGAGNLRRHPSEGSWIASRRPDGESDALLRWRPGRGNVDAPGRKKPVHCAFKRLLTEAFRLRQLRKNSRRIGAAELRRHVAPLTFEDG